MMLAINYGPILLGWVIVVLLIVVFRETYRRRSGHSLRSLEHREPEETPMELVVVGQFGHRHEAEIALGYLKDAGIDAALLVDDAYGFSFSPPRIMVSAEQADEARDILESVGGQGGP